MAGFASLWSWLIEEHLVSVYLALELVARAARHMLMPALQRKSGFLVVEQRWFPLVAVMAFGALQSKLSELVRVRILMALIAGHRSIGEVHMQHRPFKIWRLVAVDALHSAVRTIQCKFRSGVIEACHVVPVFRLMARCAT